jgi:2-oxoisovalerate dehydrogenase E1 component alpha subunit
VADWHTRDNPINRYRRYLEEKKIWSEEKEKEFKKQIRAKILKSFNEGEKRPKPAVQNLFEDVYAGGEEGIPWNLMEQRDDLKRLLKKYPNELSQKGYVKSEKLE